MLEILTREEFFEGLSDPYDYEIFPGIPTIHSDFESTSIIDGESIWTEFSNIFKYFRFNDPDTLLTDVGIKFISLSGVKDRIIFSKQTFPVHLKNDLEDFWGYLNSEITKTKGGFGLFQNFLDSVEVTQLPDAPKNYSTDKIHLSDFRSYSTCLFRDEDCDSGNETWWKLKKGDREYIINCTPQSWSNYLYTFNVSQETRKIIEELFALKLWILNR